MRNVVTDKKVDDEKPTEPEQGQYGEYRQNSKDAPHSGESEEEDQEESASEGVRWPEWFCSLSGNEFFCEIDDDFILDNFNLTGLPQLVSVILLSKYDWAHLIITRFRIMRKPLIRY